MAFKTLTIKESTYRKIANWKQPGESFSDVLEREFSGKMSTGADLLAWARANKGKKTGLTQRKPAKTKAA
jgi:predicted CopG family antitoxin